MGWIYLAQDGVSWRILRTFEFHKRRELTWTGERLSVCQGKKCFLEFITWRLYFSYTQCFMQRCKICDCSNSKKWLEATDFFINSVSPTALFTVFRELVPLSPKFNSAEGVRVNIQSVSCLIQINTINTEYTKMIETCQYIMRDGCRSTRCVMQPFIESWNYIKTEVFC
jgi:hypothetical protein